MRQALVAGNWKMNGSKASISSLVDGIKAGIEDVSKTKVVVCPPHIYLETVASMLTSSSIVLGAQNVCQEPKSGAYTGETSTTMLEELGCHYAIIGHSERRNVYGESDEMVAQRYLATRSTRIAPILCVGEQLEEREKGQTDEVVARQLDAVINAGQGVNVLEGAVIAYEPVWAIGTGKTATTQQAQEVHEFIRKRIAQSDAKIAEDIQILYGGSVKSSNAADLFNMPDIDGGLIGGASLDADEFLDICRAGDA